MVQLSYSIFIFLTAAFVLHQGSSAPGIKLQPEIGIHSEAAVSASPVIGFRVYENPTEIYPRDDDDDETTVSGPGAAGILAGLNGIFANIVKGDLTKLVESTFNFVPPAYHNNVKIVYNGLLGKPPPKSTTESSSNSEPSESNTKAPAPAEEDEAKEEQ